MTTTEETAPAATFPSLPEGRFGIDTTTVDGRPYAMLYCKPCGWYAYHVSRREVCSRIGDLFRMQDLSLILAAVAGHECPPEVLAAAPKGQDPEE